MSQRLRESLSAVMDGEANQFEVRRVLDELRRDERLRRDWLRFGRLSAALQGGPANARRDLADRVWERLQNDAPKLAGASATGRRQSDRPPAWGWLTAAAALAAVGISFGVLFTEVPDREQTAPVDGVAAQLASPRPAMAGTPPHQDLTEIEAYMMQHIRHKTASHPDVAALTKLAVFETGGGEL